MYTVSDGGTLVNTVNTYHNRKVKLNLLHANLLNGVDHKVNRSKEIHIVFFIIRKILATDFKGCRPQPHQLVGRRIQIFQKLGQLGSFFPIDARIDKDLTVKALYLTVHLCLYTVLNYTILES
jgi:hypothetical protein